MASRAFSLYRRQGINFFSRFPSCLGSSSSGSIATTSNVSSNPSISHNILGVRFPCPGQASYREYKTQMPPPSKIDTEDQMVPPKVRTTKIGIVIRSFDNPLLEKNFWGLPPDTRKIRLPESRVLYTVLRSPHIDKKSREQFEMRIKKQFLVIKTERHELRKKFFWLKRQRIFGAQYEVQFSCKTRLDKEKLQSLL